MTCLNGYVLRAIEISLVLFFKINEKIINYGKRTLVQITRVADKH